MPKATNRTSFKTSTLDDLLEIVVKVPPLSNFSAYQDVDLWWSDCCTTRRVKQSPMKPCRPRNTKEDLPYSSTTFEEEPDLQEVHMPLHDRDDPFKSPHLSESDIDSDYIFTMVVKLLLYTFMIKRCGNVPPSMSWEFPAPEQSSA